MFPALLKSNFLYSKLHVLCNPHADLSLPIPTIFSLSEWSLTRRDRMTFFIPVFIEFLHKKFLATAHKNMVVSCLHLKSTYFHSFVLTRNGTQASGHIAFYPQEILKGFYRPGNEHTLLASNQEVSCVLLQPHKFWPNKPISCLYRKNLSYLPRTGWAGTPNHERCDYSVYAWGGGRSLYFWGLQVLEIWKGTRKSIYLNSNLPNWLKFIQNG